MKTRVISALAMVPLLLVFYFGGFWLMALVAIASFLALKEFYNGYTHMEVHPNYKIGYGALAVLYAMNAYMYYMGDFNNIFLLGWLTAVVIAGALYMFNMDKVEPIDSMATTQGLIYIVFFAFHVVLVDELPTNSDLKWLILLTAFGSDIFAYFTGMLIGRHKLCPSLSPKKTIEGAIGGVAGSVALCALFGYIFMKPLLVHCIVIGLIGSPISMLGDLTASAYKRKMGIKDYGDLIPGHGGVMDRIDSVLFTAPFVYYYIVIVMEYFAIGMPA
ncbi:MAG: phosphatidate cytidylyltransferase [Eubacterium sp.]|nr:phosphatidate cytidylyltransferase [Eubacterium sp.]